MVGILIGFTPLGYRVAPFQTHERPEGRYLEGGLLSPGIVWLIKNIPADVV